MSELADPNPASSLPLAPVPSTGRRRWLGLTVLFVVVALFIGGTTLWVHQINSSPPPTESFRPR